jgi:hypothetical protein
VLYQAEPRPDDGEAGSCLSECNKDEPPDAAGEAANEQQIAPLRRCRSARQLVRG